MRSRLGRVAVAASVALALLSLLLPSAPGYDALAWLVWGREIAGLELDTRAGPAWKPLPVALTTAFAIVGEAASPLWLAVACAGGLLAVLAAFPAGRAPGRTAGRGPAGVAAAVGLTLTAGFAAAVAVGSSEGLLIELLLLAVDRHLAGKPGQAFLLAVAGSLLRPEVWPFRACYAAVLWRAEPGRRPVVIAAVLAQPPFAASRARARGNIFAACPMPTGRDQRPPPGGDTRLVEYRSKDARALAHTARALLFVDEPYENHNGGQLAFGPDGLLYLGLGDGGHAFDPGGRTQDLSSALGKVVRVDVDGPRTRWQVAAYGLRNPWRFSFDAATGDMYVADVGQDRWEEIKFRPSVATPHGEFRLARLRRA